MEGGQSTCLEDEWNNTSSSDHLAYLPHERFPYKFLWKAWTHPLAPAFHVNFRGLWWQAMTEEKTTGDVKHKHNTNKTQERVGWPHGRRDIAQPFTDDKPSLCKTCKCMWTSVALTPPEWHFSTVVPSWIRSLKWVSWWTKSSVATMLSSTAKTWTWSSLGLNPTIPSRKTRCHYYGLDTMLGTQNYPHVPTAWPHHTPYDCL